MPRMIDQEERDRVVVEAAWRVIVSEGVAALSVRRVAAEAGLAPSSLRYTFPTQASVRERAVAAVIENMRARVGALDTGLSPREWARAVLHELLPLDAPRRTEMEVYLALGLAASADASLQPLRREYGAVVRDVCLRAAHALGRTDPEDTALLYATIDGLALHLVVQEDAADTAWAVAAVDRWIAGG